MRLLSKRLFGFAFGLILAVQLGVGPVFASMVHTGSTTKEIPSCCLSSDETAVQAGDINKDQSLPKRTCCDLDKTVCQASGGLCSAVLPGFIAMPVFEPSSTLYLASARIVVGVMPPHDFDPPRL